MIRFPVLPFVVALAVAMTTVVRAASPVAVTDAWAKPASGTGAIYATITNSDDTPDRLIGAMAPSATSIELHDALHGTAVVPAIVIPAHGTVTLSAAGPYLTAVGLKNDLQANDAFLTRLHFERAGWIVTIVRVRAS